MTVALDRGHIPEKLHFHPVFKEGLIGIITALVSTYLMHYTHNILLIGVPFAVFFVSIYPTEKQKPAIALCYGLTVFIMQVIFFSFCR